MYIVCISLSHVSKVKVWRLRIFSAQNPSVVASQRVPRLRHVMNENRIHETLVIKMSDIHGVVGHGSMGMSPLLFMVCCWKDVFNWHQTTQVMLGRSNEGDFNNQPSLLSQYSNILTVCWGPFIICCWLSNDLAVYLVAQAIFTKLWFRSHFEGWKNISSNPIDLDFSENIIAPNGRVSPQVSGMNMHCLGMFGLYQTPYRWELP